MQQNIHGLGRRGIAGNEDQHPLAFVGIYIEVVMRHHLPPTLDKPFHERGELPGVVEERLCIARREGATHIHVRAHHGEVRKVMPFAQRPDHLAAVQVVFRRIGKRRQRRVHTHCSAPHHLPDEIEVLQFAPLTLAGFLVRADFAHAPTGLHETGRGEQRHRRHRAIPPHAPHPAQRQGKEEHTQAHEQ